MGERVENFIDAERRPQEECGVVGVYLDSSLASKKIINLTLECALEVQHRGEVSAGVCAADGRSVSIPLKEMGKIQDLNRKYESEQSYNGGDYGHIGLAHNRYPTTGPPVIKNAGPFRVGTEMGAFAVAHNGNITNAAELKSELLQKGFCFTSTTDSEVIGALIAYSPGEIWEEKTTHALARLEGAFSLVILTKNALFAARDVHGIRPLSLALFEIKGKPCFAFSSETSSFTKLFPQEVRDLTPGELVKIEDGRLASLRFAPKAGEAFCGLEPAYLMRPDSRLNGVQMDAVRRLFGEKLAESYPIPETVDFITYIPESARPAAEGYARRISLMQNRYVQCLTSMIKGRYGTLNGAVRGFIHPNPEEREKVAKDNYYPFDILKGCKICLIDDSIIRGITTRGVVKMLKNYVGMLKNSGVAEVHLRIVFPPVIGPCPFGVDISEDEPFLVARELGKDIEAIAKYIGADSLAFLTPEQYTGVVKKGVGRDIGLCLGCATGHYPVSKFHADKTVFENEIK